MPEGLLEMTKDVVRAMIQANILQPENVQTELHHIHALMMELQQAEATGQPMTTEAAAEAVAAANAPPTVSVDWKKSINRHSVACLECGATFRQLSARHLSTHDLNPRSYRRKYGIPPTQSLSAREVTIRRRQLAKDIRPWEKAHVRRGHKK